MAGHYDDKRVFEDRGGSKLIVSLSLGSFPFLGGRLSPVQTVHPTHHGDLLIMDGKVQEEHVHCADSSRDRELHFGVLGFSWWFSLGWRSASAPGAPLRVHRIRAAPT